MWQSDLGRERESKGKPKQNCHCCLCLFDRSCNCRSVKRQGQKLSVTTFSSFVSLLLFISCVLYVCICLCVSVCKVHLLTGSINALSYQLASIRTHKTRGTCQGTQGILKVQELKLVFFSSKKKFFPKSVLM